MRVSDIAQALHAASAQEKLTNHSFLVYGPPKTGKTALLATLCRSPQYDNIYWFDIENGSETILTMYKEGKLTLEQVQRIILIKVPDTRESPTGIQTLLKTICSSAAVKICEEHGRVGCAECQKANKPSVPFEYRKLGKRDAVVIDSLSQAGASALNLACLGKPIEFKPGYDEYGATGKWLGDLCTVIQAAAYCDIYAITHQLLLEDDNGKDTFFPLCGTKTFSANVAKHFGTVIYMTKKLKKHTAESTTTTSMNTLSGSRMGLVLEASKDLDLAKALTEVGFFPSDSGSAQPTETPTEPVATAPAEPAPKFGSRFGSK